jgi:hypothetical protein
MMVSVGIKMSKNTAILSHPDREEVLAKIQIGRSYQDISEWLKSKYTLPSEKKFIISVNALKKFSEDYLDIYNVIQEDLAKTRQSLSTQSEEQLQLTLQNSPGYKNLLIKSAEQELDIRKTIKNLCVAIETRLAQVFDEIQANYQDDPRNINMKVDRLLIEYTQVFGDILDKYYKFTEGPTVGQVSVQNNITLQVMDEHISVFHDVIKEVLSNMDLETSLYFMEVFNEKMQKLKMPDKTITPSDVRLAEAQVLNETITNKLN